MSKIMLTRTITAKLTFATYGYANRHGAESRLQILADATSAAIYMIAMLHHDLEFFIDFVVLGFGSGSQIRFQIVIRIHSIRTASSTTFIFFFV